MFLSISVDLKVLTLLFLRQLLKRLYIFNKTMNRLKHPHTIKTIRVIVFDAAKTLIVSEFLNYLRGKFTTGIDRILDRVSIDDKCR